MSLNSLRNFAIVLALTASGSAAAAAENNDGPQQDPNFPPVTQTESNVPLNWSYGTPTRPTVHFKNPAAEGDYIGFNDRGSMVQNQGNGKVYIWNGGKNTLTVIANNVNDISVGDLESLKNTDETVGYLLAKKSKSPHGPQKDSNLPPISYNTDAPIDWIYGDQGTIPVVQFKNPPDQGTYMGFNENGSMIRNMGNGKIYYWKLKNTDIRSGTLTEAAKSYQEVPLDTLAALQNPTVVVRERLAMNGRGPMPEQPVTVAQTPPRQPPSDKSGGLFGTNPQKALQGLAPTAGSPTEIAGKNASIQGGVLTFTLENGSRSKPYTVVRPTFMANAPQASGIAGTWVAMESAGKGLMFNVQSDNSVTGKEISPQVVQMLMQGAPKPH